MRAAQAYGGASCIHDENSKCYASSLQ